MLGTHLTHRVFLEKKKKKKRKPSKKSQSILSEICYLCFFKVFSLFAVKKQKQKQKLLVWRKKHPNITREARDRSGAVGMGLVPASPELGFSRLPAQPRPRGGTDRQRPSAGGTSVRRSASLPAPPSAERAPRPGRVDGQCARLSTLPLEFPRSLRRDRGEGAGGCGAPGLSRVRD